MSSKSKKITFFFTILFNFGLNYFPEYIVENQLPGLILVNRIKLCNLIPYMSYMIS